MSRDLRYAPTALVLRCGGMLLAAVVVLADYVAHADGGFPRVFGLGFVFSAMLIATALYLVGVTVVLTLGLLRHGGVALAADDDGVTVHSAWFSRTFAWRDLSRIAIEVRYTRSNRHMIVAVHEVSGLMRCHAIDVRVLADTLDAVKGWAEAAERARVAHGGAPYTIPTTGLAGLNARVQAGDLAADLAAGGQRRPV